jgi:sialic acid synthase SpsE
VILSLNKPIIISTAFARVVLDASTIEKHFTLLRSGSCPDDRFSFDLAEL